MKQSGVLHYHLYHFNFYFKCAFTRETFKLRFMSPQRRVNLSFQLPLFQEGQVCVKHRQRRVGLAMFLSIKRGYKKIKQIEACLLHTAQRDWRTKLRNAYYTQCFQCFYYFVNPIYISPGRLNNRNSCIYNAEFQQTLKITPQYQLQP